MSESTDDAIEKKRRPATAGAPLPAGWQAMLGDEFDAPYMRGLRAFLAERKQSRVTIYPHSADWFKAFALTPVDSVRVVILGQDPYHGPGQAHGLSFSVPEGVTPPPSLLNIFREIEADPNLESARDGRDLVGGRRGCLAGWARQGVLLLNSVLTVEAHKPASHRNRGWEAFTDAAIERLADARDGIVFLLWGSYAQQKGRVIDGRRHHVLTAPHPSPLSAHRGFLGCRHFSRANDWLVQRGREPIDWFDVA